VHLKSKKDAQSVLIIRLGAVGDVIRTLPAIALLKSLAPKSRLFYLTEEGSFNLLENSPVLEKAILFPRKRLASLIKQPLGCAIALKESFKFLKGIKKKRFDTVIDMHGIFKSGLLALLSGAPKRLGFSTKHTKEFNHFFLNALIEPSRVSHTRVAKNLDLALSLATPGTDTLKLIANLKSPISLALDPKERQAIAPYLKKLSEIRSMNIPIVVLNPFVSERGSYKAWPLGHYSKLSRILKERLNAFVAVSYGPGEHERAERLKRESNGSAMLLPETSLKGLLTILLLAQVFVTADTGPMHLAGFSPVRIVALFGPSDPILNAPMGKNPAVVYKNTPCSPCRERKCIVRVCMRRINPEEIFDRIQGLLQEESSLG
jgi:3-deoxy-D-manno-octulosonic-acid transferase/heptosyltransferase-1